MAWAQSRGMLSVASGGKSALLGDRSAGDPQGCDEGEAVWVVAGVFGGSEHQGADRVVAAQVAPDLLGDQVRGLRAQHLPGSALVGLELVEGGLDLPPLRIGAGQLGRGRLVMGPGSWSATGTGRLVRGRHRRCTR